MAVFKNRKYSNTTAKGPMQHIKRKYQKMFKNSTAMYDSNNS